MSLNRLHACPGSKAEASRSEPAYLIWLKRDGFMQLGTVRVKASPLVFITSVAQMQLELTATTPAPIMRSSILTLPSF